MAIETDPHIGRGVVIQRRGCGLQFRQNPRGKLFAKFHTLSVKAQNIPDHALDENLVLIDRNQLAEHAGR